MPTTKSLLDLTRPVTVGEVLDAYEAHCAEKHVPAHTRRATLSVVTRAFAHSTGATGAAMRAAPANGLLADLPHAARAAHRRAAGDAASRTRRFVSLVTGLSLHEGRMTKPQWLLDPAYAPLAEQLPKADQSHLVRYARLARAATEGKAPAVAPEPAKMDAAAKKLEIAKGSICPAETAYRRAREAAVAADPALAARFAPLPPRPSTRLTLLQRVLGVRGEAADETLARVAPLFARQVTGFVEKGIVRKTRDAASDAFRRTVRSAGGQAVAWMVTGRDPEFTPDFSALDFIERTRSKTVTVTGDKPDPDDPYALPGEKTFVIQVPLLEALIERESPAIIARSKHRRAFAESNALYPEQVHQVVTAITALIHHGWADKLKATDPARWQLIDQRLTALKRKVIAGSLRKDQMLDGKDKRRLIRTVTYPMVVCLIIPMLRRKALSAKAAYERARDDAEAKGHAPRAHPEVIRLRAAWGEALLDYLVVALPIDDGMRIKNYQRGRWGVAGHFRFEILDGEVQLWSHWTRRRGDDASRKDRRSKNKKPIRSRRLRPGIVDPAMVMDWVREHRVDAMVAARIIPAPGSFDFERDYAEGKYALLLSPDRDTTQPGHGYSHKALTQRYGRVLNGACREWLGRDIPPYEDCGPEWRHLWAMHTSRLKLVTYWGGVRGRWDDVACHLTDDKRSTAEGEYSEVDHLITEMLAGRMTWQHPEAYDEWMDRLYDDFDTADPLDDPALLKPEALVAVLEAEAEVARLPKRRRRHQGPKLRRARPGQRVGATAVR